MIYICAHVDSPYSHRRCAVNIITVLCALGSGACSRLCFLCTFVLCESDPGSRHLMGATLKACRLPLNGRLQGGAIPSGGTFTYSSGLLVFLSVTALPGNILVKMRPLMSSRFNPRRVRAIKKTAVRCSACHAFTHIFCRYYLLNRITQGPVTLSAFYSCVA